MFQQFRIDPVAVIQYSDAGRSKPGLHPTDRIISLLEIRVNDVAQPECGNTPGKATAVQNLLIGQPDDTATE